MEFKDMSADELQERKANIALELEAEGADLDALETEVRSINEELEERKAAAEKTAEIRKMVAEGEGEVIQNFEVEERKTMTDMEMRNSAEYIHAFANYIKTGDDAECRSLLTENASGTVAVPEMVDNIIRTAWDKEPIIARVRKSSVKGNLKVGFEISATGAVVHTEGESVSEETLTLGIVTMVPETIKKWISVSDEVLDLDDGSFLEYIYSELAYQIAMKLSALIVADIIAAPTTSSATAPAVPTSSATTAATTSIITAEGELCDEANDLVVIMTKAQAAALKSAALSANYGYDPFDGLTLLTSSAADGHILVGDLKGVQLNYVNGQDIQFKFDDKTLATSDLVRIIGRLPVAHAVVAPNHFVDITIG